MTTEFAPCDDCGTTLAHEVIGCPPAVFIEQWHVEHGTEVGRA